MTSSPKILVGIDGTAPSVDALAWADSLAQQTTGTVHALMTWNYPTGIVMPVVGAPVVPAESLADMTRIKLETTVGPTVEDHTAVKQSVVMGSARTVLADESSNHDLLVLGRTGHNRLQRMWLGSTASYCVRHADCPVVIVDESTSPERAVTVAVDGSPSSIEALVWALGLGPQHDVLAVYSHDEWQLDELAFDDVFRQELRRRADELFTDAVDEAIARAGVEPSRVLCEIREGDPRTTIVEQADPNGLLVLGAQGHSGLARWMLGSLADYAVHHGRGSIAIWR